MRELRLLGQSNLADEVDKLIIQAREFKRNIHRAQMNSQLVYIDSSLQRRILSLIDQATAFGVPLDFLKATVRELKHEG